MSVLNNYIEKMSETPFSELGLNVVDVAVLAQFSYFNIPHVFENSKSGKFYDVFQDETKFNEAIEMSDRFSNDKKLFALVKNSNRYTNLELIDFFVTENREVEGQFAGFTFKCEDLLIVVFRGTDNTFTGWLESLAMSFRPEILSQKTSKKYLSGILKKFKGKVIVCGHSKGGNLAVFSSSLISKKDQKRIVKIFNFDGPGFLGDFFQRKDYKDISMKVENYLPQDSIVGRMLTSTGQTKIIKSKSKHLMQHLPHNWHIDETDFSLADKFDKSSDHHNNTLDIWLQTINREDRKEIVEALTDIVNKFGADRFSEFLKNKVETVLKIKDIFKETDKEQFEIIKNGIEVFYKISKEIK